MIEVAVRQILLNAPAVRLIAADRIWFQVRPQDERRAGVVLSLVSAVPAYTFNGIGGAVNGRIQLSALAPSYPAAKQLAAVCRKALDGFSGCVDQTTIAYLETDNMRDVPALPLAGAGMPATFGVNIDVRFMHKE